MTTTPDLTAPESTLIQWLADTVGLPREVEAELARRLAGLRAAPESAPGENLAAYALSQLHAWASSLDEEIAAVMWKGDLINQIERLRGMLRRRCPRDARAAERRGRQVNYCSMCGAPWVGAHACSTAVKKLPQFPHHDYSDDDHPIGDFRPCFPTQMEADLRAELTKLRADLEAAESMLREAATNFFIDCPAWKRLVERIKAFVEREAKPGQ